MTNRYQMFNPSQRTIYTWYYDILDHMINLYQMKSPYHRNNHGQMAILKWKSRKEIIKVKGQSFQTILFVKLLIIITTNIPITCYIMVKWQPLSNDKKFYQMTIWGFPKIRVPQHGLFIMEIPIKLDDLGGNPPFSETSTWVLVLITKFPKIQAWSSCKILAPFSLGEGWKLDGRTAANVMAI